MTLSLFHHAKLICLRANILCVKLHPHIKQAANILLVPPDAERLERISIWQLAWRPPILPTQQRLKRTDRDDLADNLIRFVVARDLEPAGWVGEC